MTTRLRRVVLLSLDAVRFDAIDAQPLGAFRERHGSAARAMPRLDTFLREGTLFRTAYTTAPYTTTAHASVFTGTIPPRHGVRAFYRNALAPSVGTLAELFRDHGFDTWFFSDRPELFEPLELTRGFGRRMSGDDELLASLEDPARPVFVFAHLFDAHKPYLVPGDYGDGGSDETCRRYIVGRARTLGLAGIDPSAPVLELFWSFQRALAGRPEALDELVAMYWAGLSRFDRERLGRYTRLLGDPCFLEDSLVIVFSDHGEDAVPGQVFDHGGDLTEGKLRVLLAVAGAGWPRGEHCDALVSLMDVFPTCVREALGHVSTPATVTGRDLRERWRGGVPLEAAYAETWRYQTDEDPGRPERGPLGGTNWLLIQRGMRTAERLWVLRGQDLRAHDQRLGEADDPEYVKRLYRGLLGRYEDAHGAAAFAAALRAGRHTRRSLYRRLRWSRELWQHPLLIRFELARDPLTERPIAARCGRWREGRGIRQRLREIEAAAPELPELAMTSTQETLIAERLQALGYLE